MFSRLSLPRLSVKNCAVIAAASAFQAFGLYHIHSMSGVTEGGVLGLTLLLDHLFGISPGISGAALNAVCYLLGWRLLGKAFIGYSAVSTVAYSVSYLVLEQFPHLWPEIYRHPLAAALDGAVFVGIGSGLCVRMGGATSGDDALAMSLSHLSGIPIERIYLASDLTVLLLSLCYIPLRRLVFSLLTVLLSGQIIGLVQRLRLPCLDGGAVSE